jgi:hypothetical protein
LSIEDGVMVGGVQFAPGKVGTGFWFSGSGDDYIALPENLFPMPTGGEGALPFSFELWFQTTASGVILGQQDLIPFNSTLLGYVPAIYVGTNGFLYAQMFWGDGAQLVSPNLVNDGQFHHLVITYDGAAQSLYLDGQLAGNSPFVQTGYAPVYQYQFGTGYTGGWEATPGQWFPFTGVLDELSLYDRALSSGEVAALFQSGTAGKCAPAGAGLVLRHRYGFNGPSSSLVITDSVRRAHGALVFGNTQAPYTNGIPDGSGLSGNGTLELRGDNGCVLLPPRLVSVLSNFTIEAWITWNGPRTSVWQRVFDFGISDVGTNANGIGTNYVMFTPARGGTELMGFEETTVNPFGTVSDPQSLILNGPGPFAIEEEVYVAITYDPLGGSSRLYLNGELAASATGAFNLSGRFTDYSCWLGRSQWHRDPYFNGSYNEFRIWEGVLSDAEVASHYAAGPNQQFVTTRPTLNISPHANGVAILWRSNGGETFQLQSTLTLNPPSWSDVGAQASLSNGIYRVELPVSAAAAFYRLRQ